MAKLRKMLGNIYADECTALMRLIESQSKETLMKWAIAYAKENYLPIYEQCTQRLDMREIIETCEKYCAGECTLKACKETLRQAKEIAKGTNGEIAQASARAISTACATILTPTNAFGFLLYGAATRAYSEVGLLEHAEVYDTLASKELWNAYHALEKVAIKDEKNPVNCNWGC